MHDRYGEPKELEDVNRLADVVPIRHDYWTPTESGRKWIAHIRSQLTEPERAPHE